MENINIAVLGTAQVGKSTLIQRALDLRGLPSTPVSGQKMSVDNVIYRVSLIELGLDSVKFHPDHPIQWPLQILGQKIPRMDGSLLLYDVMNRASIIDIPQILNAFVSSDMPTILVSCKCDNPVETREIDMESIQAACLAEVETVKTASNAPESARLCLGAMLRAIIANRNAMGSDTHTARRRAVSSATAEPNNGSCQTRGSSPSRHNRASSEFSVSKVFPSPPMSSSRNMTIQIRQKLPPRTIQDFSSKAIGQPISQESVSHKSPGKDISVRSPKNDKKSSKVDSKGSKAGGSSFLDMEESDADSSHRYSDDLPILQPSDDAILDPSKASGTTFDELVDRLLSQPMSKADMNFIEIFLCLYRKFAAPGMLLSAILARLEKTADDKSQHFLTRTSAQLRIVAVLTKWISTYPGDFASPHTSQQFNTFLEQISLEPAFNYAAHEMKNTLRSYVAEDDDTRWERTDPDVESDVDEIDESLGAMSLRSAANASKSTSHSSLIEERVDHRHSEVVSVSSGEVSMFSGRPSGLHTVADYEVEAATMVPCRKRPLTKIIYHSCMDISDDDFADEITRIDWVMFSSVRVRDLIRDVSLSSTKKARCRSLVNVSRAISHFNHVACWVTNMILMRDKAKHRARILEKFMRIAWKLRQLNNYNGLAAVMAGIQNTAVARLAQTQALISDDCRKQFMRLEILMGPRKSHFAYRLAWQNSPLPRIPYVPLSRRDLASAEEGSKTFIGSRINWAKFSLLGDVILPILATRGSSYDIPSKGVVRELILDSAIAVDDEELYARSLVLEQVGVLESKKRFFKW